MPERKPHPLWRNGFRISHLDLEIGAIRLGTLGDDAGEQHTFFVTLPRSCKYSSKSFATREEAQLAAEDAWIAHLESALREAMWTDHV